MSDLSTGERLTDKQQRFVEEYLVDLNATQAAIRAGYSEKTAGKIGYENLQKPEIIAALAVGRQNLVDRTRISQDRVLKELGRLAFLDIRKAFDDEGRLRPVQDLDDDTAAGIAGLEVVVEKLRNKGDSATETRTHKIKLADKKGALDSLARHLGMFNDKIEHSGGLDIIHYKAHDQKIIDRYNARRAGEQEPPTIENKPAPAEE
jgi:phage terminase small subunit